MAYSAICIMSIVWVGIQFNCLNLYAAPVVEEMGISRAEFMVVLSIPGIISATVSLLFFGTVEEKLGMRRMLLIGGILNTLAFVSWFLMDSLPMLYLGGALYGFGCSVTAYNSVAAGVNRWFKQREGSLMGIANALGNVAGIAFAMVIATLIATVGWRYSFGLSIVLSMLATIACVSLYRGNPSDLGVPAMYENETPLEPTVDKASPESPGITFKAAIAMPRLWMLAVGYLLLGTISYGMMSTLPLFALDFGFADLQGHVVSVSLFAAAAMMVPLGIICDRVGTKWTLALCGALMVLAALLLQLPALPFIGLLVASACSGAAYSSCGVAVGTGVKEAFGEVEFSKKLGVCSGFMYIGLALGPALINFVYDTSGTYATILLVFAALSVAMVALFFVTLKRPAR